MWSLIVGSLPPLTWKGILPADTPVSMQNAMPYLHGVGFTSIGLEPGNDAAKYGKATSTSYPFHHNSIQDPRIVFLFGLLTIDCGLARG